MAEGDASVSVERSNKLLQAPGAAPSVSEVEEDWLLLGLVVASVPTPVPEFWRLATPRA